MKTNTSIWRQAKRLLGIALLAILTAPTARAANVTIGNHVLLPNTANQVITIHVIGNEEVAGEDFFAQIGDGGQFLGGVDDKPVFTNVDILTNTIFANNNDGVFGDPYGANPPGSNAAHPLIWVDGTITANETVTVAGLLATLTIDTTGLNSGTFPLMLSGVASPLGNFDTVLRDSNGDAIPLTMTAGSLIVAYRTPGDFNRDGVVDAADYTVWRDMFGNTGEGLAADSNTDQVVDASDYEDWASYFGESIIGGGGGSTPTSAVPEPATLLMVLVAAGLLLLDRRTSRVSHDVVAIGLTSTTP